MEDNGYCVTSDTIEIKQLPEISVDIIGNHYYCFNDSVDLAVGNYDSYHWSNGDTTQIVKVRDGVYSITVINSNGCKAVDQNWRVHRSNPTIEIFSDSNICDSELGLMYTHSLSNEKITWSTGDTTDSIMVYPGDYFLNKKNVHGCTLGRTYIFDGIDSPTAGLLMNPETKSKSHSTVEFFDDSQDNGTNVVDWYWNISDSIYASSVDTSIIFYNPAQLIVTHAVAADNGCTDTISISYSISSGVVKTNVITPNGDGLNDYLVFPNLDLFETKQLVIYNRWGVEVAKFDNYLNNWDAYGFPDGVYFYIIYLGENAEPLKGSFTIIR